MKVFSIVNNFGSEAHPDWMLLPDSAMIREGKPVFLPDDEEPFVMLPSLCIRIGRLGKHISEKFASRYFDAVAPAVQFMPLSAAEDILNNIVPAPSRVIFDNALVIGDFSTLESGLPDALTLKAASPVGEASMKWDIKSLHSNPATLLALVSAQNTVKMGDLILLGLPPQWLPALRESNVDANFSATIENHLSFKIK